MKQYFSNFPLDFSKFNHLPSRWGINKATASRPANIQELSFYSHCSETFGLFTFTPTIFRRLSGGKLPASWKIHFSDQRNAKKTIFNFFAAGSVNKTNAERDCIRFFVFTQIVFCYAKESFNCLLSF